MLSSFEIVAHADWGSAPGKRRLALARQQTDGTYRLVSIEPVWEPFRLLHDIGQTGGTEKAVLLGFDFPIGLPIDYAKSVGVSRFLDILPLFGEGEWENFYHPAQTPDQIHLRRPFYPLRSGGSRYTHLLSALSMDSMDRLRRRCELAHNGRRAASPLFWTLGGQQVGKAAMIGWRDVLAPALREPRCPVFLWPFSGTLEEGLRSGKIVAAECYPGEYYGPLGIRWGKRGPGTRSGKRSTDDRRANAGAIEAACSRAGLILPADILEWVQRGFGDRPEGEDCFDALAGLLGMLFVLRGFLPEAYPDEREIRQVEGWILGQRL